MAIDIEKIGTGIFDIGADTIGDPFFDTDSFDREYAYAEGFQNDDPDQPVTPANFTGWTPTAIVEGGAFAMVASFPTPANGKLLLVIAAGDAPAGEYCYAVTITDATKVRTLQKGAIIVTAQVA